MAINFLDFEVFDGNLEQLISEVNSSTRGKAYHFCSADAFVQADLEKSLVKIFQNGVLICDSRYLQIYLSLLKKKIEQIRGADFLRRMIFGGDIDLDEHLFILANYNLENQLKKCLSDQAQKDIDAINIFVPGILGHWNEANDTIEEILKNSRIKYVWIGIGSPKQFYLSQYISAQFGLNSFSIGAAFDFVLGTKNEASIITRKIGAEWLLRLCSEPKRLWRRYLFGNFHFIFLILRDFWR